MGTKKPKPVFEVVFTGVSVYPEKIPIGRITDALSAVRRLAAGFVSGDEDDDEDVPDTDIHLLDVGRTASAVYRFVAPPQLTIPRLRETGRVLANPDDMGQSEYILRPVKDLSAIAKSLGCSVVLRQAGNRHEVLARIESDSYERISKSILITGSTQVTGRVQRVGGATAMRCALRVSFQPRLLYCRIESEDVARKLGDALYQRVVAFGTARWLKGSMRIFGFTINDVAQPKTGTLSEHFQALWNAGLKDWEKLDDPDAYLQEIRGNE